MISLITSWFAVLVVLLCSLGYCRELPGQQPAASGSTDSVEAAEAKKHFQYFDALAHTFRAKLASGDDLQIVKEPPLKWTIGSSWYGSFYVWTSKDRPVLVGCFLTDSQSSENRRAFIEMHTIVDEPFTPIAISGVQDYEWAPSAASQSVVELPSLPQPVGNAQQIRTQMRRIAESFSVLMYEDMKVSDRTEHLRMLSVPFYRYPEKSGDGLIGAIYAFVRTTGTDPEFMLAIEHDPKRDAKGWQIRPIRFATRRLELHHGGAVVWRVDEYEIGSEKSKLTEPYMITTLLESSTLEYNAVRDHMIETSSSKR